MFLGTTNIHGVKAIRLERTDFGSFVSHKVVFETDDGVVEVSGFAPHDLPFKQMPDRVAEASQDAIEAA